jgi:hypothetical protein
MAAKKPAIQMTNGIDDIIKATTKAVGKAMEKNLNKTRKTVSKAAKNDIPDKAYKKIPYNRKGGMTKDYSDYVMRNSKGQY